MQDLSRDSMHKLDEIDIAETSTSLDLLLQFQRLLIARLFPREGENELASACELGEYISFILIWS